MQGGKVKFETLKGVHVVGCNDNVGVLVAMLPLVKGDGGKLLFDICFAVGVYSKDFVPIVCFDVSLGHSNCSQGEGEEGNDRVPHCGG